MCKDLRSLNAPGLKCNEGKLKYELDLSMRRYNEVRRREERRFYMRGGMGLNTWRPTYEHGQDDMYLGRDCDGVGVLGKSVGHPRLRPIFGIYWRCVGLISTISQHTTSLLM